MKKKVYWINYQEWLFEQQWTPQKGSFVPSPDDEMVDIEVPEKL